MLRPLPIPPQVTILETKPVIVRGAFGEHTHHLPMEIEVAQKGNELHFQGDISTAILGLHRALVRNMLLGAAEKHKCTLQLVGIGFRANISKNTLELQLGKSHPITLPIPNELEVKLGNDNSLTISGCDKQKVGQYAAKVRKYAPPEPYKGKGIHRLGEKVRRKSGKSAKGK